MPTPQPNLLNRLDQKLARRFSPERPLAFMKANRNLILWLCAVAFITYSYDLFSFSLKIDSENHAYTYGPFDAAWVGQGRWGMYLLSLIFIPDVVMPVIPTLLALTGLVIGSLFFVHALSSERGWADYLAGAIAITCPVLYFALYFTTLGYGVGIAFMVCCIGIYLLRSPGWLAALMTILCWTLGIGIYQAVLPFIACLYCLQQTSFIIEKRTSTLKQFFISSAYFSALLVAAIICNQLISAWVMKIIGVSFHSEYLLGFIHFQLNQEYFLSTIAKTYEVALNYYTGGKDYYLYDLLSLKIIFISTLVISCLQILLTKTPVLLRLLGLLLISLAIIAPLLMHILNAGYMPPRTVLGVSFVIAALVFFGARSKFFLIRCFVTCLALSCIYHFSVTVNRYAFSSNMTWEADKTFSTLLLEKIHTALNKLPHKTDPYAKFPFELVGWNEYFETPVFTHREVIGSSFYQWAAGDPDRIAKVFQAMGEFSFRAATREERISVIEAAQSMPSWPYEGSVDVIKGIVVVKLQPHNPNQLATMCQPPNHENPACIKYAPH